MTAPLLVILIQECEAEPSLKHRDVLIVDSLDRSLHADLVTIDLCTELDFPEPCLLVLIEDGCSDCARHALEDAAHLVSPFVRFDGELHARQQLNLRTTLASRQSKTVSLELLSFLVNAPPAELLFGLPVLQQLLEELSVQLADVRIAELFVDPLIISICGRRSV